MKKKNVSKLKFKKASISNLKGGAASNAGGDTAAAAWPRTWNCGGSAVCTYSCFGDYSCFCGDIRTVA